MNVTHAMHPTMKQISLEERILLLEEQIRHKQDQIYILRCELEGGKCRIV